MASKFKTQAEIQKKREKTGARITSQFKKSLKSAISEKDVEHAYWEMLRSYYPEDILDSRYNTDGVLETMFFKLLMEVKFDKCLLSRKDLCSILIQVLYYIKIFELNNESKPNLILVGDKDECFIIHSNHLFPYLDEDIDWSIAPSSAAEANPQLVLKLEKDNNIKPFIFSIAKSFNCNDVKDLIDQYATSAQKLGVKITEKNIARIYDDFLRTVIRKEKLKKFQANELVSIFIMAMTNPNGDTYIVPNKINTLHLSNGKEIQIDGKSFDAFFCQFDRNYSPKEIDVFNSIADRLLVETERRFQGSYWTPNIWVDKAHEMLTDVIGESWKEDCVVWDASCGSMNLTRDYRFGSLFCSTLFQEELDIAMTYNPEAIKFQYDFLNDDLTSSEVTKAPKELVKALSEHNKPIVFFNNPPYAQAGEKMGSTGGDKKDVAKTNANKLMLQEGYGQSAQQLYAQFIYRFIRTVEKYNIEDAYIGLFSPPLFLTGNSYKAFRKFFFKHFEFVKGICFKASNFADVQDTWGIAFTIFKRRKTDEPIETSCFDLSIMDIIDNEVKEVDVKTFYNMDNSTEASQWVRKNIKGVKTTRDYLNLQSAITYDRLTGDGAYAPGSLGYFMCDSNNVYENSKHVGLFSAPHAHGHGLNVMPVNFDECVSLFAARALISSSWINQKDEYMIPDMSSPKYAEWLSDSIVYSIFSSKSGQSSLRNVQYKGKTYSTRNEWFYLTPGEISELANDANDVELYNDAKGAKNSFVYDKLASIELSKEAQDVLDSAREITRMLIRDGYRLQTAIEHPEYHLRSWDAGWYQMRLVLKEYKLPQLDEFDDKLKALERKMRPLVYELGFLK